MGSSSPQKFIILHFLLQEGSPSTSCWRYTTGKRLSCRLMFLPSSLYLSWADWIRAKCSRWSFMRPTRREGVSRFYWRDLPWKLLKNKQVKFTVLMALIRMCRRRFAMVQLHFTLTPFDGIFTIHKKFPSH